MIIHNNLFMPIVCKWVFSFDVLHLFCHLMHRLYNNVGILIEHLAHVSVCICHGIGISQMHWDVDEVDSIIVFLCFIS